MHSIEVDNKKKLHIQSSREQVRKEDRAAMWLAIHNMVCRINY